MAVFQEGSLLFLCFSMPLDNNVWYARVKKRVGVLAVEQNMHLQMFIIVMMLFFSRISLAK